MSNKIPWKAFSARRKITLKEFIGQAFDKDMPLHYGMIVEKLEQIWVEAPSEKEFIEAISKTSGKESTNQPKQTEDPKSKTVSRKTRSATQKSTKSKSTASEDPQEVWEDAQEGAYQTKKAPTRKTSTRKTSTRKTSTRKTSTTKKKS